MRTLRLISWPDHPGTARRLLTTGSVQLVVDLLQGFSDPDHVGPETPVVVGRGEGALELRLSAQLGNAADVGSVHEDWLTLSVR
jgi:hypothetical protein